MASETTRVAESLFAVADLASMRPLSGAGFMHSLDQQYRFDRRRAHLESTHCVRWWTIRALRWIKSRLQSGHSHSHGLPRRRHIISSSRSVVGAKSNQRDTPFVGMDALVADQVALASERFGAPFESTIERPADEAMLVNKMVEVHRGVGAEYWCLGKTLSSGLRERDGEKRAGGRGGGGRKHQHGCVLHAWRGIARRSSAWAQSRPPTSSGARGHRCETGANVRNPRKRSGAH